MIDYRLAIAILIVGLLVALIGHLLSRRALPVIGLVFVLAVVVLGTWYWIAEDALLLQTSIASIFACSPDRMSTSAQDSKGTELIDVPPPMRPPLCSHRKRNSRQVYSRLSTMAREMLCWPQGLTMVIAWSAIPAAQLAIGQMLA